MKRIRVSNYHLIIFTLGLILSCCSNQKGDNTQLITQRIDQKSINVEQQFDSLFKINSTKILFLEFWEGMTEDQYNFALSRLIKNNILIKDTIPENFKTPLILELTSEMCNGFVTQPYFPFYFRDMKARAIIQPKFSKDKDFLNSINLDFVGNMEYRRLKTKRDPIGKASCSVSKSSVDSVLNLYSTKYGTPSNKFRDSRQKYIEYLWSGDGKIIIALKNMGIEDGNEIIYGFSINYWNLKTYNTLKIMEQKKKQQEFQHGLELKQKTKDKI